MQPEPEKGAQCLNVARLHAAGIGEPRRKPEGPYHGQHVNDASPRACVVRVVLRSQTFVSSPFAQTKQLLPESPPAIQPPKRREAGPDWVTSLGGSQFNLHTGMSFDFP